MREGGILVLPKGGSREDLQNKEKLYDYISSQALEWFQFSDGYKKDRHFVTVPNGTLYLVTGVDKVPEWSVFSFWQHDGADSDDNQVLSVDYTYGGRDPWSSSESDAYSVWETHCPEEVHGGRLATAFVRGLRIGLSPTAWEDYLPTELSDSIYNIPTTSLLQSSTVTPNSFVRSLRKIHPEMVGQAMLHLLNH